VCSRSTFTCLKTVDRCLLERVQWKCVLFRGWGCGSTRRQLIAVNTRRPRDFVCACLAVHLYQVRSDLRRGYSIVLELGVLAGSFTAFLIS